MRGRGGGGKGCIRGRGGGGKGCIRGRGGGGKGEGPREVRLFGSSLATLLSLATPGKVVPLRFPW